MNYPFQYFQRTNFVFWDCKDNNLTATLQVISSILYKNIAVKAAANIRTNNLFLQAFPIFFKILFFYPIYTLYGMQIGMQI